MRYLKKLLLPAVLVILSACTSSDPIPVPVVNFIAALANVTEGGVATVSVTLSAPTSQTVTVPFTLTGTATQGSTGDYTVSGNVLTIAPGSINANITVTTVDDAVSETGETVILTLGAPTNATLGSPSVSTLTIQDNDVPPPVAGAITGRVTNAATGNGLMGVVVSVGAVTTMTTADGSYSLSGVVPTATVVVSFSGNGLVPQSRSTDGLTDAAAEVVINVPMLAVALTEVFDSAAVRTLSVPSSVAQVQLPANALRTASGGMPVGMVTARVTPIAPGANPDLMPGNYMAATAGGAEPIESFGAINATFTDANGNALNLAAGMTATLRIPVSSRSADLPATIPLFFFDTVSGLWREEATATLMGTAPNQFYEGAVPHFSTWNADLIFQRVSITGCVQDAAGVRVRNASVTSEGVSYTGRASARTNNEGVFTVFARRSSSLVLGAERRGVLSNQRMLTTGTGNQTLTDCLVIGGTGGGGQIGGAQSLSVRLTWGAAPSDLDSYALGPNLNNQTSFNDEGSLTVAPFVALDVDDTSGFGPEFITFSQFARNRTYVYFVDNFSRTFNPGQTGSPAQVQVVNNGVQTIFTPPEGEGTFRTWHVFNITTDANCRATVVPVQQFVPNRPANPNADNNAQFCTNN